MQNINFKPVIFCSVLIVFLALIGACSSDSNSNVVQPNQLTITSGVDGAEFAFDPDNIEVGVSETIKIVFDNKGTIAHDFEIPDLEVIIATTNSGNTGAVTLVTPSVPGTYDFICSIPGHKEAGMVGKLIVK